MTDSERKAKIKDLMIEHLKSKNWPNVSNPAQLVFDELAIMWNKIDEAGLKKSEWNIHMFQQMAVACYNEAQLRDHFKNLMNKARGR